MGRGLLLAAAAEVGGRLSSGLMGVAVPRAFIGGPGVIVNSVSMLAGSAEAERC